MEAIGILTWPSEISSLLLCKKGTCDDRLPATITNFQERLSNPITGATDYSTNDTPNQDTHNLQTRNRPTHC